MKADVLVGGVLLLVLGTASGCATTARTAAVAEATPVNVAECEQITGSRIRSGKRTGCAQGASPLKSFSQEELEATGEMDLNSALRQVDPAFQ